MKLFYAFIFYFFFVQIISAQVTISLPTVSVNAGDNIIIYPRLTTKDSLSTLQFTLKWDASTLQYVSADSLFLPLTSGITYFGDSDAATTGYLRFAWTTPNPNKPFSTLIDSFKLFRLKFKAALVNAKSAIAVVDTPVRFQAVNGSLAKLSVKHNDGQVSVLKTSGVNDIDDDNFKLFDVFPNPFLSKIIVPFYTSVSGDLRLEIFSIAGEKVFNEVKRCVEGYDKENISLEGAPTGLYFLRACYNNNCLIKKILKE